MNTYPIRNVDGQTVAFEIENVYVNVGQVVALLRVIANVTDIRVRKLFSPVDDIHIEFVYMGNEFIVLEPFGDNSRYWIGPKDKVHSQIDVGPMEKVFQQHRVGLLTKVIGDLISLKFLRVFNK